MGSSLRADLRTISACLTPARRREFGLLLLLMPATALAEALTIATIVPFLGLLSGQPVGSRVEAIPRMLGDIIGNPLWMAATMFALIVLLTATLRLCLSWLGRHFAFALGHEVSVEIQRRLLSQPYAYHLRRHSSEYVAALDKVDMLVFDLAIQGVQAVSAGLIGVFVLAVLFAIDPLNSLVAFLIVGGFYAVAMAATRKGLRRHGATISAAYEQRTKFVQESIGAIRDLILDHSQEAALDRFRTIDGAFAKARTRTAFLAAAPRFLIEAAGLVMIALLAIMIAGESGGLAAALPFLGALALGAMRLLPLIGQIFGAWANLSVARPVLSDVSTVLRLPPRQEAMGGDPVRFERSIEVRGLSFTHADRAHRTLEQIELTIPKGARVAITGKTGSGKSTLVDLLLGLIVPDEGEIRIDGVPLTPARLPGWHRSIAHVPQQIFLADDSIAANISLSFHGGEFDPERIERAARQAQLHEFIESLPDGYNTRVGERGFLLSGGQRQRLAFARALYKRAPVLVLDEPTSALDEQTAIAISDALDEIQVSGTTIIIVAHRPSTLARCDAVFLLEDGRLVDDG